MQRTESRIDGLKVAKLRLALPKNGKRHVSQAKLAERTGLHWVTISNIERGAAQNTTLETAGRLAQALGCEIADLLADENDSQDEEGDESVSRSRPTVVQMRALTDLLGALQTVKDMADREAAQP